MNNYARLALFLIVLALSVGLLSSAINTIGEIDKESLNEDVTVISNPVANPAGLTKSNEVVNVTGSEPGKKGPLFYIRLQTLTRYLRKRVAVNYTSGTWSSNIDAETVEYNGETIPVNPDYMSVIRNTQFFVKPVITLSGFVVVAQDTQHVEFNTSLLYYPEHGTFESPEPYEDAYWVSYRQYNQPESALRSSAPVLYDGGTQIPGDIKDRFRVLANEITLGKTSPFEKYRAIERYLLENYNHTEDYVGPPWSGVDPVEWFLFNERKGIATHFNTAFILLARSIGLPARGVVGYRVDPVAEFQYVLPQQVYFYAEVEFANLGWVIFDSTPKKYMEGDVEINKTLTKTNITGNDPFGVKGEEFHVWGFVKTLNDTDVSGPQIEVILKVNKYDVNETGSIVGVGIIENGLFNVTCTAPAEQPVGNYNLIAHTISNREYKESWSDPPIKIISKTVVTISGPHRIYSGKEITYRGTVLDALTQEPMVNRTLILNVADKEVQLRSDSTGRVDYVVNITERGGYNMTLSLPEENFFLGSSDVFAVTVIPAPPSARNILQLLLSFPYNIILATTVAVTVGVVAARRKRADDFPDERVPLQKVNEGVGFEDDVPLTYTSYEEGVVKLFNRFYITMQRIYPEIEDTMTPREFEATLIDRIPQDAYAALNDLVTNYEIAMYSNIPLTKDDFGRTTATIELVIELMKNVR